MLSFGLQRAYGGPPFAPSQSCSVAFQRASSSESQEDLASDKLRSRVDAAICTLNTCKLRDRVVSEDVSNRGHANATASGRCRHPDLPLCTPDTDRPSASRPCNGVACEPFDSTRWDSRLHVFSVTANGCRIKATFRRRPFPSTRTHPKPEPTGFDERGDGITSPVESL